jgi:gluconate/galactonate dehydratase
MGKALKKEWKQGYTFLKMDLGIGELFGEEGTLSAPLGFMEEFQNAGKLAREAYEKKEEDPFAWYYARNRQYDMYNIAHPFTGIHITEKGIGQTGRICCAGP